MIGCFHAGDLWAPCAVESEFSGLRPARSQILSAPTEKPMSLIRRRTILVCGGGWLTAPFAVRAQLVTRSPRIGFLALESLSSGMSAAAMERLRSAFRELGYIDGRTISIEVRSAEGRPERLAELAHQLVESRVDVILAGGGNLPALAARKATSTIPIVMISSINAVESGLVESLAQPGGNTTGVSVPLELGLKQVELLHELVPSPSHLVLLARGNPARAARRAQVKAMLLQTMQMTLEFVDVQEPEDLAGAFETVRAMRPNAMLVEPDLMFFQQRDQIIDFARTVRLPTMYPDRDFVVAGGLMSFSVSLHEMGRIVVRQIDKILKGARPADLPVEQPNKFELVINSKTAKALGLVIPPAVLLRADEVI